MTYGTRTDSSSLRIRDTCESGNTFNGEFLGARISSVFVLLAVSALGSFFPLVAKSCPWIKFPAWVFFCTKYIGTGVIVATGFIHLLAEAHQALSDPCLGGVFEEYPWTEGIALMGVFLIFFLDVVAHKKIEEKEERRAMEQEQQKHLSPTEEEVGEKGLESVEILSRTTEASRTSSEGRQSIESAKPQEPSSSTQTTPDGPTESVYQQMLNSLFLEFGIVFHSVFVGLSLAISGDNFKSLYVAIVFHQLLEGLGLGTRFATTPWPDSKWYIPWLLSLGYSLTTPIAIAIGIGVRQTYPPGSRQALITTGVFDALCGGILIYNSLVELMAYDFFFSLEFKGKGGMRRILSAYFLLCVGGAVMSVIGKWA